MNKRILKLFNKAGFHQPEMERLGIEDKFEKFAELIVRECVVDFYRRHLDTTSNEDITSQVERYVQEHFGV